MITAVFRTWQGYGQAERSRWQDPRVRMPARRIQTAGLAFGGTDLCSYRVRGVEGSCAEHLAIEFYMVVMLLRFILVIISIPSPPRSYIPGLKPSFSANPFHHSLPFLLQD